MAAVKIISRADHLRLLYERHGTAVEKRICWSFKVLMSLMMALTTCFRVVKSWFEIAFILIFWICRKKKISRETQIYLYIIDHQDWRVFCLGGFCVLGGIIEVK